MRSAPTGPPSSLSARDVLPADLDIVLWLDVSRAKQYWLRDSERAVLGVLVDYGLFPARATESDLAYLLHALKHSERLWLACRPHAKSCEDPVVLLRGNFAQFEPRRLPHTAFAADLGGGWLRYDVVDTTPGRPARSALKRVYFAPPDRLLLVSYAELDAVERALEHARGTRLRVPTETGLLSMQMRPQAIAKLVEGRAPFAARWLRDAQSLELVVVPKNAELLFEATIAFDTNERAERAGLAFRLVAAAFAKRDANTPLAPSGIEVLGQRLVVRLVLRSATRDPGLEPNAPSGDAIGNP